MVNPESKVSDILARETLSMDTECNICDVVPHFLRKPLDVNLLGLVPGV